MEAAHIYSALTEEQISALKTKIEANCIKETEEPGCWTHTFASRGGSHDVFGSLGIPLSSGTDLEGKKVKAHRFMAMLATGRPPLSGDEASHLCGNPRCVRKEHMWWESGPVNQTRKCCHIYLGLHPTYTCPHTPACIKPLKAI